MFRALSSAILASAALLASAGVSAQAPAGYYVATASTTPTKARLMTRDTPWQVRDGVLVAARSNDRESILCPLLAREVGALTSFTVGGKAYDAEALDKCNAKAGLATPAMASSN